MVDPPALVASSICDCLGYTTRNATDVLLRLRYLADRRWSLLLIRGFLHGFLLPLLCVSCCCFWLFFSASGCSSAGSSFLFSLWVLALGWGSAPAVLVGWSLPQVPQPFCFHLFSVSEPPLLSCALSESSRLRCFCSWSLGGFSTLLLAPRPGCWLSFSQPVPLLSLPQPAVRSATSSAPISRPLGILLPFTSLLVGGSCGFHGGGWLQILRLGCLLPFLAPLVLPLTSCAFLLF